MSSSSSMELCLPPNLYSLEVVECHELRELPILPTRLVHLDIRHVGLTNLLKIGKLNSENVEAESSCLLKINVKNCQRLVSLEGSLLEQKKYMGGLQYLDIRDCINVESVCLPFEEMNRLNILSIHNCPKVRTLRGARETC
uniref:Uncharacterized protein n=1 Tax=Arundo donax TaxID=35708 RepID=A0A0A9C8K4_ARUDO